MKTLRRAIASVSFVGLLLLNSSTTEDVVVEESAKNLTDGTWTFSNVVGKDKSTSDFLFDFIQK
ncbi:MAG: hypothetical protein L3J29_03120 [Cyclobacteriaceae bacterium]|nr:hypothetical protein [Cyclobacteriaceae bacterium]